MANVKGRPLVIHPLLFAAAPILILYAHNIDQVPIGHMLPLLGASFAIAGCAWLVLRWILKSSVKAGLVTSVLWIIFFSYGHLHSLAVRLLIALGQRRAVGGVLPLEESIFLHSLLRVIALAAGALLISKIIRTRSSPDLANTLLNITGTALLAMPLIGVAHYAITSPSTIRPRPSPPPVGDMSGIDRRTSITLSSTATGAGIS